MCVRSIDQDAASPINALESVSYSAPMYGENDDVALGCLLLRAGDGASTEISDKIIETSLRGWGSCHASTRPEVRRSYWASASVATSTCGRS